MAQRPFTPGVKTKVIGLRMEEPLHDELHALAIRRKTTRNAIVREAMVAFFAAQKSAQKPA